MNKILTILVLLIFLNCAYSEMYEPKRPHKPTIQEERQFDKMLEERLKLTDEQKAYIKENRPKHKQEMEKTIYKMEELHSKIKDVYSQGMPKYQADIITAPYKTELGILKQNAQNQKMQNRKNFENILTKEQKEELEKMKQERPHNRPVAN